MEIEVTGFAGTEWTFESWGSEDAHMLPCIRIAPAEIHLDDPCEASIGVWVGDKLVFDTTIDGSFDSYDVLCRKAIGGEFVLTIDCDGDEIFCGVFPRDGSAS